MNIIDQTITLPPLAAVVRAASRVAATISRIASIVTEALRRPELEPDPQVRAEWIVRIHAELNDDNNRE
jgi:hypothetical protein